ncbi:MAG: LysM peptidoglycan-binding domain-containing protein [Dehalobacter sp. 4CP]|nr:LysM peptidoglycan-binding domain-containing protein [Dehalobacter sp. 4CP]
MHHQVHKGDNLSKIARLHGVTIVILLRLNPHLKKRRHRIYVGEKIRVS